MKNNTKKIFSMFFICAVVFIFSSIVNSETQLSQNSIVCENDKNVENLIWLTNKSRIENGVHPLEINKRLVRAAEAKIDSMFEFQYFGHDSPEGESPFVFVEAVNYYYDFAGENLVMGFVCAETVQQSLMESHGHRENILSEDFDEIGVSIGQGLLNGEEVVLIVYFFGSVR